jgi:CheY-like chemotaxis protein
MMCRRAMSEVTSGAKPDEPSHTVLVVDDDDAIRLIVTRILARAGFVVTPAIDGQDAIEKLQQQRFDAIVLDLMMARVNGYEVIAYVREHLPGSRCVIVVSAAAERAIDVIDDAVVAAKMRKPFDLATLVGAVEKCVGS